MRSRGVREAEKMAGRHQFFSISVKGFVARSAFSPEEVRSR
jgi:hypothetical protein